MKTWKSYIVTCLFSCIIFFITNCSEPLSVIESDSLFSVWVEENTVDGITILRKTSGLDKTKYGFIIYSDGDFTERKNSGWCGTPPIVYANYEGNWEALIDNMLEIEVGYWGGTMKYQMEIVSLYENELQIKYHFEN